MQITRTTLPLTGPISRADLQLLNDLTVALEQTDLDAITEEVEEVFDSGVARPNYFRNPGLDLWTRGTTAASLTVATQIYRADDWWARCNSKTGDPALLATYEQIANGAQNYLYAAKITGNTGMGSIDFGQDIPAHVAAGLTPTIVVTFTITNSSGAALTPQVRLDTCDSFESYSAVTNRAAVNTSATVASGATTTFNVVLDLSAGAAAAALRNGAQLYIRIATGLLTTTGKNVAFSALKVEVGAAATPIVLERELADPSAETVLEREFLINGDFHPAKWATTSKTCTEDTDNYAARGWFANPSDGSTLVYSRSQSGPDNITGFCALLTGSAATTGTVDFGQNIESTVAALLVRQCTFSAYIYNGTGAAFSPSFRIDTCDAANVFTTVTNREAQTLTSCADAAWTRVSFSFNGEDYANLRNGARIIIRFPSPILNSGADTVRIAQAKLELGTNVTDFDPAPTFEPGVRLLGFDEDMLIVGSTTTTIAVTCSRIVLMEPSGLLMTLRDLAVIINSATTGANGIDTGAVAADTAYYIWAIADRVGNGAAMLSLSGTAPTLPAGYVFKALIGWTRFTGSDFRKTMQRGRRVTYRPLLVFTGKGPVVTLSYESVASFGGSPTLAANYLAAYAPPTITKRILGNIMAVNSIANVIHLAADANGMGEQMIVFYGTGVGVTDTFSTTIYHGHEFMLDLVSAANQDFFLKADYIGADHLRLQLTGFEF